MTTYTYDDVRNASLSYFNNDQLAAEVFSGKYALKNIQGEYLELTPFDMHQRLAREFSKAESKYDNPMSHEEILGLFSSFDPVTGRRGMGDVIPQGSPMSAIGNDFQYQSLSNCFVIESPYDSYGGIMKTDQEQAQVMKRRGGVGFDISTIRPRGLLTANAARTTDGIGVFMERFSNTCREVAQGGRRGALMLTISVHHPEIRTFINIKRNKDKVTGANISIRLTDEFMNAVKHGTDVELRFPVENDSERQISESVDAQQLWTEIIDAAHACAEPGLLFWDTVTRRGPADAYPNFRSTSTNPCLTGDTKIAVADGRGYVDIKTLANDGIDLPVYCVNDDGKIVIRTMRNPRVTGYKVPVYKVTIEGGHSFRATLNHTMIMRDGTRKRIDQLIEGDQLWTSYRAAAKFAEALPGYKATQSQNYWWVRDCNSSRWKTEHRAIWEHANHMKVPSGHVIHHVDFNASNNHIDNLRLMSKKDHDALHAEHMCGENNPIFKIKADPKRFAQYSAKMSESVGGINNPRAYDHISNDDIRRHAIKLTKQMNRRVSINEWQVYAKENGLPMSFSGWRESDLGTFYQMSMSAAKQCGLSNIELDTRIQRTLNDATSQGYDVDIINGIVCVNRMCEMCGDHFVNEYWHREIAFCGQSCSQKYANQKANKNVQRSTSLQTMHANKAIETRKKILDIFTELRFKLNRNPLQDEVKTLCKERIVSYRTGTMNGFKSWADVKEQAQLHNHRVISVEYVDEEDVYNGTVDDVHNLCIALGEEKVEGFEKSATIIIASEQCGEITLSPGDSCRLMLVNLNRFVVNPFTEQAFFDFGRFDKVVQQAQRLMDDLVDLEIDAIKKIRDKIIRDPEPEDVKRIEIELWDRILKAATDGRRTGLGITALGDALAAMGIRYGSDESIIMTEQIYRGLALGAYRSTICLAKERGTFPAFSHEIEKDHPFIRQILAEDDNLASDYHLYGRRNIALTTTAPAGSVSIITQTTSGCEPVYKISYTRRKKHNPNDINARVDSIDNMGDKWQHYTVFHHGVQKWMEVTGKTNVEESPYHNATSDDIDWVKKIDIQAAAQKWICHSISNTTNLPKGTTIDTVKDVYMHGWVTGCKGVTVYVEGSRDGVLVSNSAPSDGVDIVETDAPKRPKILACDIHRANVKGESYLVLVGLLNGKPYEIFCGLSSHVEIPKKFKSGMIVKNGKNLEGISTYNFRIPMDDDDDDIVFKDIVNLFDNPTYGSFTRTISLAFRHGVPLKFMVEQLRKDKHSDMWSFNSVIARVLSKNYIPDGTKTTSEKTCHNILENGSVCGSPELNYQQGCLTCMNCGSSKCQ